MSSTALFSKTPPLKLFFLASLPGAVSMLASALYQTIDGIFVGQFLGPTAFAALNLAMPFVIINFVLADLIGVGSGIVIGAALFLLAPLLIRLMGAEGFIQPLMYGTCDSLQPAVGYNWGAQNFSRVRAIEKPVPAG